MKLVVWNSQGGKWDIAWSSYLAPLVTASPAQDVIMLLVESGWGPWVASGDVVINNCYSMDSTASWFSATTSAKSSFCQGVEQSRRYKAVWVPWVKNLNALKTNSRCFIGGAVFPSSLNLQGLDRIEVKGFVRPTIRMKLGRGNNTSFTILLVPMISGYPGRAQAQAQLTGLGRSMQTLVPTNTAALVVGDMNVNLLTQNFTLPYPWSFVNTGVATQQSGGELDYGLLYDPAQQFGASAVSVRDKYKSGANPSDHLVLLYDIPIK